jgi:hypothetical protein
MTNPKKQYEIDNEIYELEDEAHEAFQTYLRKVGEMERLRKEAGRNQLERNFFPKLNRVDYNFRHKSLLDSILIKAIDEAKTDEYGFPYPRAAGVRWNDEEYRESSYAWALYHVDDLPSYFDLEGEDLAYYLTGWARHYSGPGRSFSHDPYYRKVGKKILVKQFRGLDI